LKDASLLRPSTTATIIVPAAITTTPCLFWSSYVLAIKDTSVLEHPIYKHPRRLVHFGVVQL
jgi:hypothetical protein